MALSSSLADPPSSAATNAATVSAPSPAGPTTPRLFTTAPPPSRDPRPPTSSFPQSHYHYSHHHHHATTFHHPQPPLYTAQSLPNLAPRLSSTAIHPQLTTKSHEPSRGILYPVASSGRGFLPKAIRPQPADQTVTVANPGGFPPRPAGVAAYPQAVRPFGFPHSDSQGQAPHLVRPTHLQHTLLGSSGGAMSGMVKGVPPSAHLKVAPSQPSVSDCNGYKDQRDKSRDDTLVTVRDRKVRIYEGSSLYALCRSWLRNGFPEENEPHNVDVVKVLPKPLSTPVADPHLPIKKEGNKEEEEEEEKFVENLSPKDLLQRHIKRAKRVRARLREDRLQRIARYKSRLALLLPPLAEQQQFTNDAAAAN